MEKEELPFGSECLERNNNTKSGDNSSCESASTKDIDNISNNNHQKNVFDKIGDFFEKMIIGILKFAFYTLPRKCFYIIWNIERLRLILCYIKSISRAIIYGCIWVILVFGGCLIFKKDELFSISKKIWMSTLTHTSSSIIRFYDIIADNWIWIWMVIAICGSCYGLVYVTLKKRKNKKEKEEKIALKEHQENKEDTKQNNDCGEY